MADWNVLTYVQTGYTETTPPHTLDCSWLHHSIVISWDEKKRSKCGWWCRQACIISDSRWNSLSLTVSECCTLCILTPITFTCKNNANGFSSVFRNLVVPYFLYKRNLCIIWPCFNEWQQILQEVTVKVNMKWKCTLFSRYRLLILVSCFR